MSASDQNALREKMTKSKTRTFAKFSWAREIYFDEKASEGETKVMKESHL